MKSTIDSRVCFSVYSYKSEKYNLEILQLKSSGGEIGWGATETYYSCLGIVIR